MTIKKVLSIFAVAMMLASCSAAEGNTPVSDGNLVDTETVGLANPWTEYSSLEELNEAAGTNLQLPGVMGVTDATYRLMTSENGTLAEINFKVNGVEYTLRGSADLMGDISGVYLENGKTAFEEDETGEMRCVTTRDTKLAAWSNVFADYVLIIKDNGEMDEDTFHGIAEEIQGLTLPSASDVTLPDGTYWDAVSQRASATVKSLGNDTYAIEIHWADSATVDNVWKMTAALSEDGSLTYHNCVRTRVETAEDGTTSEVPADLIPDGYFVPIEDGVFSWAGSPEESCQSCVFQLAEE